MESSPPNLPGRPPIRTTRDPSPLARTSSSSARSAAGEFDSPSSFSSSAAVSQSLSSILNNPHAGRSDASWSLWWPSGTAAAPDFSTPIIPSTPLPDVTRSEFQPYLAAISDSYSRFEDVRNHSSKETSIDDGISRGQGDALVACLREVPALFFKEDFALEEGATFRAACPFSPSQEENMALQERLTQYLDVVEMHLVREIALRSDSFFEAQGQLQRLNGEIVEACIRIRELKETIRVISVDLVGSARQVQDLNATRGNLVALQQKLTVILYVSQALSALKLLVAAADCAGALDVIDDLQHLLETDELSGLHCFRHIRDQLVASLHSINNILSVEFLRAAIHDAKVVDSLILSRIKTRAANMINGSENEVRYKYAALRPNLETLFPRHEHLIPAHNGAFSLLCQGLPSRSLLSMLRFVTCLHTSSKIFLYDQDDASFRPSHIPATILFILGAITVKKELFVISQTLFEVKLDDDDESCILRDRLLPLIIGLLRTARLPTVLRIYRDTLISDMKAAIKTTVAEMLPVLLARPLESDSVTGEHSVDSEGGGLSLASKLRSLSSESFVQLLISIFKIVQAHLMRAVEVKQVIEWIMGNLDGYYAADAVASAIAHGAAVSSASDIALENDNHVFSQIQHSFPRNAPKIPLFHGNTSDASSPNTSKNFRADVLRENTEAVFAACDAAHGRWAKLLGVRALLHPRLKLHEFLCIYNITQDFIAATEKIGGRLGYSIRGTLQSQSKAFIDYHHESRMSKIKAVLDQETWVAVDVPDEFQAIITSLSSTEPSLNKNELVSSGSRSPLLVDTVITTTEQAYNLNEEAVKASLDHTGQSVSPSLTVSKKESGVESAPSTQNVDSNINENGRSTPQTIVYGGVGYHMVNCGLILLKMLSEYVDISKCLPTLSSEVVHRVVEILKLFNTHTCRLVLGAGAMQVAGLKSITSKHLALASQIISFIYVIIPEIRRVLFLKMPDTRKGLLSSEIDKVAQDYKLHRDEIHTKLVQIMRERLLSNLRKLPQIVESWNGPEDNDLQPSQFARSVTKEVTFLHRILSQILLDVDLQTIFRQVIEIFHSHISEAFSKLDISTTQAKNRLYRDVQHILGCIRRLPSDSSTQEGVQNFGLLDEFLAQRFSEIVDQ